jgi:hypothetical protein
MRLVKQQRMRRWICTATSCLSCAGSCQSPFGPQPTFSGIHGDKVAGNFGTTIKPKFRA